MRSARSTRIARSRGRLPAAERARPPWTPQELALLDGLKGPEDVQAFLDTIPYNDEITCRSPRRVLRDRKAHCTEGALLAAAALEHLGLPPLLVNLRAVRDDDHVIVPFRLGRFWGSVAKSNYVGLRYRSPVYASLRELVMSYFDVYYNPSGELTLRAFSLPMRLTCRRFGLWQVREDDLDEIGEALDLVRHSTIVTPAMEPRLRPVDRRSLDAGLMGANAKGLYKG